MEHNLLLIRSPSLYKILEISLINEFIHSKQQIKNNQGGLWILKSPLF